MKQLVDRNYIETTFPSGKSTSLRKGEVLSTVHQKIEHVYWLLEGELSFSITLNISEDSVALYSVSEPLTCIGWAGFYNPRRFLHEISIISPIATFYSVPLHDVLSTITWPLLNNICERVYDRFRLTLHKQVELLYHKIPQTAVSHENYYVSPESSLEEKVTLLRGSPFFGEFEECWLKEFARKMERRDYEGNEQIYEQDQHTEGLYILIEGEVTIKRIEGPLQLEVRSISTPGYIFGWSSVFGAKDICDATTHHKTALYLVPSADLIAVIQAQDFYRPFYSMLIGLMGNHLQLASSRYVQLLSDHDILSVDYLIDNMRPKLRLSSSLHQVPHLLKDTSTRTLAFETLHTVNKNGNQQERQIASICLDLLKGEEKESRFMENIRKVYEDIAINGEKRSQEENRASCSQLTQEVFAQLNYQLDGWENLPEETGSIFIYNHLVNHPHYTLNNQFQLTLDSHFISSMILNPKYGDSGIRTVRIGRGGEYGHQDYYTHLGHINVYTSESDIQSEDKKAEAKERFYKTAETYLTNGYNLIISPEGTSFRTEESPGPFKMGPFNLAARAQKEPYIVPIVFCHFDKRITDTLFYCKILPPFKISEHIQPNQSLRDFVDAYQQVFAQEMQEALKTVDELLMPPADE